MQLWVNKKNGRCNKNWKELRKAVWKEESCLTGYKTLVSRLNDSGSNLVLPKDILTYNNLF